MAKVPVLKSHRPSYVFCFWQYEEGWKLIESIAADGDGYFLTQPQTFKADGRHPWTCWLNHYSGDDDDFPAEIMGRAVTMWDVSSGVKLMGFHPPRWVEWLSTEFYEELKKLPNWDVFLEDGRKLHQETAREVERKFLHR